MKTQFLNLSEFAVEHLSEFQIFELQDFDQHTLMKYLNQKDPKYYFDYQI
jgi:hypothetical protein